MNSEGGTGQMGKTAPRELTDVGEQTYISWGSVVVKALRY